jgi:hypothetical protein
MARTPLGAAIFLQVGEFFCQAYASLEDP